MQDFTGHAQDPLPETKTSASPEKTSNNLSDFTPISVSGLEDVLETEAVAGLPAESGSVSASEMDSVVPSITCSLSSTLDPHSAPDSAPVAVSGTLGTEGVYAGCSGVHLCDSDEPYMIPDADWVTGGDALLADLESTTSHISKQGVFLPEETPYSCPRGSDSYQDVSSPPRVISPPAETLNGSWVEKPESKHSSTQSFNSAPKSSSPRVSQSEEEHVYSFPNKQKSIESPTAVMNSSLGSNLSELDRLLLELNAVQHSTPAFPAEETCPPKPANNSQRYVPENGVSSVVKAAPPKIEKPKRNIPAKVIEDARPSVESLLNKLESSIPAPVAAQSVPMVSELRGVQEETPAQQQARISASSATRELDELMASLSDFKVQSNSGSLLVQEDLISTEGSELSNPVVTDPSVTDTEESDHNVSSSNCTPLLLELHIVEELATVAPVCNSTVIYTSSKTHSEKVLVVSSKPRLSPEPPGKTPSLPTSSINNSEVKPPKTVNPKTSSPLSISKDTPPVVAKVSSPITIPRISSPVAKSPSPPEMISYRIDSPVTVAKTSSPVVVRKSPSPITTIKACKSPVPGALAKTQSPEPGIARKSPVPTTITLPTPPVSLNPKPSKEKPENSELGILGINLPCPKPLLEEALDKLLTSSLDVQPEPVKQPIGSPFFSEVNNDVLELLHQSMPQDGLGKLSWMDEFPNPASHPGASDVSLDLPLLQPSAVERLSASGQLKSVIRRTKETPNVHPMFRDGHLRKKMGPVFLNKSNSQDLLIEELQGKLGIGRSERPRKQPEDWLTEGVIVCSNPQRLREEGGVSPTVDKIIIPPDSPSPQKKVLTHPVAKKPVPVAHIPAPLPPPPPPPREPSPPPAPPVPAPPPPKDPTPPPSPKAVTPPPPPKVLASVGCQTEYEPLFPPIMAQGKSSPTSVPKQGNKLDNMLGSLQSDLNRLGVQTVAKGVCGACKKPIAGQVVTAMGRTWHPEHFVCTQCQEEIGSRNFFERDGQPYCEKDYHSLFSPRCYYCSGPILDKVVTALDKTWHPEHFFCAQCGSFFGPEGFHEKEGKAYCRKDYFDMFAPKCGGCARAILENYISALNSLWHPECFVCRECFTPFVNGSFFEHEGQPYCEAHYHERRGSLCSGCQKPITGRCITAMGKKFHPEHFVCAFCLKQLNKGTFKEQNDKPYCQGCFIKLFS
ncbi:paxillin a isoform X1 [Danio aesculapii]|uniref:paxillin a isoform X1 n=1 Tax=Danio aesculapii TaxID=1142201 RepID=UPI0024C0BBB4|nr:paxillin a isoform X1 [Danio aesculapii]